MANNKQYTKDEIQKIVKDEIRSFVKSELEREVKNLVSKSNGDVRKEMNDIVKNGLAKFAEFMFIRKSIWQNDIK
jgi:hypothetical protein